MRIILTILVSLAWQPLAKAAETSVAPPTTLRVTLASSLRNPLSQNLIDFKNAIEEDSVGAVRVEMFDDAQLYSETAGRAAVSSGEIDIAVVPLGDYAGDIPAAGLFQQPFLFDMKPLFCGNQTRPSYSRNHRARSSEESWRSRPVLAALWRNSAFIQWGAGNKSFSDDRPQCRGDRFRHGEFYRKLRWEAPPGFCS